jgi:hypothetical protein
VVSIAHLPNRTFDSVTAADAAQAQFTLDLFDEPFDPDRVILIQTDRNAVFKLGNPVEDPFRLTFDYAQLVAGDLPGTTVHCGPVKRVQIPYETAVDLDMGLVVPCVQPCGPFDLQNEWDLVVAYNSQNPVHGVVFHNQQSGTEIAHLTGRTFDSVAEADIAQAQFSTDLMGESFGPDMVILLRTGAGNVFKLGNYEEGQAGEPVRFQYALLSSAAP